MDSELKDNYTMEHNEIITDELIAKYISGKTTEEENRLIHDYLAKNPGFANDLLDMAAAIRHQRKHDEAAKTTGSNQTKGAQRVVFTPRNTWLAVAASVVILIGIGLLVFKPFSKDETVLSVVAEGETETSNTPSSNGGEGIATDSTAILPVETPIEETRLADNQETPTNATENQGGQRPEESLLAGTTTQTTPKEQSVDPSLNNDDAPIMAALIVDGDNNIPTQCDSREKLVLKWNCKAPTLKIEFSIDNGATWKTSYNISGQDHLTINSRKLGAFKDYSTTDGFIWRMTAQYSDGKLVRQGTIHFVDEKE